MFSARVTATSMGWAATRDQTGSVVRRLPSRRRTESEVSDSKARSAMLMISLLLRCSSLRDPPMASNSCPLISEI